MATLSVRSIAEECLGKSGPLSLKKDILSIYSNDNPQTRSLQSQLDLIQNKPFIRIAIVTVRPIGSASGPDANLQRDLDSANLVFQRECNVWFYCVGSVVEVTDILGANGILNQDDCRMGGFLIFGGHSVSDEEDALFDLGRDLGARIVCYYIAGSTDSSLAGCAAHPDGRRGFWVKFGASRWVFAHEFGHNLGFDHSGDKDNLMWDTPGAITNPPPDLSGGQCTDVFLAGIGLDPLVEGCRSD